MRTWFLRDWNPYSTPWPRPARVVSLIGEKVEIPLWAPSRNTPMANLFRQDEFQKGTASRVSAPLLVTLT